MIDYEEFQYALNKHLQEKGGRGGLSSGSMGKPPLPKKPNVFDAVTSWKDVKKFKGQLREKIIKVTGGEINNPPLVFRHFGGEEGGGQEKEGIIFEDFCKALTKLDMFPTVEVRGTRRSSYRHM